MQTALFVTAASSAYVIFRERKLLPCGGDRHIMILKTLETWFFWMLLYSVIGWIYESILCSVKNHRLINRGFLNGPYCPIYGSGALLIILVLGKLRNPVLLFLLGALLACSLEYVTSYLMEKLFHARWWDYSERKFQLGGRVCLLGAVVFGAFSVLLVLVLHPPVARMTAAIPDGIFHAVSAVLFLLFAADCFVTIRGISGFHKRLEELPAAERQESVPDLGNARSVEPRGLEELRAAILKKINRQERRMLSAFPALKMVKPRCNEALSRLRRALDRELEERRAGKR